MSELFKTIEIEDRRIVIGGIGRMYYQDGMPIDISCKRIKELGYEISYLHIADELLKNGWPGSRVYLTLERSIEEDVFGAMVDVDLGSLNLFCSDFTSYEQQREMIFEYLFGSDRNKVVDWVNKNVK